VWSFMAPKPSKLVIQNHRVVRWETVRKKPDIASRIPDASTERAPSAPAGDAAHGNQSRPWGWSRAQRGGARAPKLCVHGPAGVRKVRATRSSRERGREFA